MSRILLLLMFVAISTFAQSQGPAPAPGRPSDPPKAKAQRDQGRAQKDERGTAKLPLVVQGIPSPIKEREEKASSDRGMLIFIGLTALFTFAMATIAALQLSMFRRQLRLMREAVDESSSASREAKRSADAATATTEIMRDTAIRQLRAYMSLERAVTRKLEGELESLVEYKNNGQTPAYDFRNWTTQFVHDPALGPLVLPNPPAVLPSKDQGGVAPENTVPLTGATKLTDEEWKRVSDGSLILYLQGKATYKDVFGVSRTCEFRLQFNPKAEGWQYCFEGNRTD